MNVPKTKQKDFQEVDDDSEEATDTVDSKVYRDLLREIVELENKEEISRYGEEWGNLVEKHTKEQISCLESKEEEAEFT